MSLSEYIYKYYRYDKNLILFDSKAFKLQELINKQKSDEPLLIDDKDNKAVITSNCQVGKSFLVIPMCFMYLVLGFTPIIIVSDTSQIDQMEYRIRQYSKELYYYLKGKFSEKELSIFKEILYYDSKCRFDKNKVTKALNGNVRRIILCISHFKHIDRINEIVDELGVENTNIITIADEAQRNSGYKHLEDENKEYHNIDIHYEKNLNILKKNSKRNIAVSATVQDIIMVDNDLYSDNIVYIQPNEHYTGLKDCCFVDVDFTENEPEDVIIDILDELSGEEPMTRYDRRHNKTNIHPINVLSKVFYTNIAQHYFISRFARKDIPISIEEGEWAVVTFNGDGIRIYHESLVRKKLKIGNQWSTWMDGGKIHKFNRRSKDSVNITDVYQYFADQGITRFPRIFTLAYKFACEAISYISHYDKSNNYHITHEIIRMPDNSATTTNAIQVLCRCLGNHGDNIRPIIYTSQKIKEKVLKGFQLHEKQINSLISLQKDVNCAEYLKDLEIFKNRVASKYNTIKDVVINKVDNPNKTNEEKLLGKDNLKCIDYLCCIEPEKYEPIKDEMIEKGMYSSESETESASESDSEAETESEILYYSIDIDKLPINTIQYTIVDETIKQIIKKSMANKVILRTDIIKWLLELKNSKLTSQHAIKGNFDVGIIPKMEVVDSVKNKGLLYWKDENRYYLRYNS